MSDLKLSVVDQVPVHDGKTQAQALQDCITLAQRCEQQGYHRYWLAEHHSTRSYACSAPEIVIGQVAAATDTIRVGSGGVMLSHYSPYKVAEQFRTLSALHPGRIDLGVGRAPGGDDRTTQALAYPYAPRGGEAFPHQVRALAEMLSQKLEDKIGFGGMAVTPEGGLNPELWSLGSSDGSIELAAALGFGFVLALFIGTHDRPANIISHYRNQFAAQHGHEYGPGPAMIASAVICADSEEQAKFMAASHTYWKVMAFRHGIRDGLKPPQECLDLYNKLSVSDQAYFDETLASVITGTPEQCREQLTHQAEYYSVDEVLVVAVTHSFEDRLQSYQKLAQAFSH